ncbi:MAG: SDR family NAD(P)-dependent oxidoreductase [Flavobacteriales bacterium]
MEYWVVITGASSGIGFELALQWANKNHKVIAIARSGEKLEALSSRYPEHIFAVEFDLREFRKYSELLAIINELTDRVDVLINNAGTLINKPFRNLSFDEFDSISDTNYKAPFFLTQLLLPLIEVSYKKDVVNIGSVGGVQNTDKFPGLSIYSSSKGAISILTECLAKELSPIGITINCLALGAVKTIMLSKAFPGYIPKITPEKMAKTINSFILANDQIISGKTIQLALSEV